MPTVPQSELPKPKSWDEFEDIVWDTYARLWQDPNANRYGRSGQSQHGVDIYGQPYNLDNQYAGIQCKRYAEGNLTQKIIEAEIAKAEQFSPPLAEYIIATTEPRDAKLQEIVRQIDQERLATGKFRVHIVFWETLCNQLVHPHNNDLLQKHYGDWLARGFAPQLDALYEPPRPLPEVPCPYRGLEPFEAEHAGFYFGREAMVERLVAKVKEHAFVAVVGASGCGKSSLVRAGLVTALREGALPGSQNWLIRIFRPGSDPLRALSAQLVALLEPEASEVDRLTEARKLADGLRDEAVPMADVAARLMDVRPTISHLVLLADQFEELYTECQDEVLRQVLVGALLAMAKEKGIAVVLALRADFYGHVLIDQRLGKAVDAGLVNVLPMCKEEIQAAIEQPAIKTGRAFEPGLVQRIMDDVAGEPGSLPLLEFALTELWARQTDQGLLTHHAYEDIGRVAGAIAQRAEVVSERLAAKGQGETVRRILLRLIHYGKGTEGTRRRVTINDLVTPHAPREEVETAVKALADARLLVTGRDEATGAATAEVSHEALIRSWDRLGHWLDEDRAFGLWRERLAVARQTWQETKRDEGALLRGAPLSEAQGWLSDRRDDLNKAECKFIEESIVLCEREAAEREVQRQRKLETARQLAEEQAKAAKRLRLLAVVLAMIALIAPGLWIRQQILKVRARGPLARMDASQAVIEPDVMAESLDGTPLVVDIPAFCIERYEVTNRQYRLCVMAGACTPPQDRSLYEEAGREDHPVVAVTAYQADDYCRWLGRRLPTELEWEMSARGPNGRSWPWGEEALEPTRLNLRFEKVEGGTSPVGSYPQGATPKEVFDLAGNVWEWIATPAEVSPYEPDPIWKEPLVDWLKGTLIIRGGSWKCTPTCLARITVRVESEAGEAKDDVGFRCAKGAH